MDLLSFDEAIKRVPHDQKRHILLGNGFSRACRNDIFSYPSLLEKADFSGLSLSAKETFNVLNTTDFEVVIRALKDASILVRLYANDKALASKFKKDASGIKSVLVKTITNNHPDFPAEIQDERYAACRLFLSHFSHVYTLNYDLLLYWVVMHVSPKKSSSEKILFDDGFRHAEADYVTWEVENTRNQNLYYLHGALHLFESEGEIKKFTWKRTGERLKNQITRALDEEMYPLIVAEGTTQQKKARIMHSGYLTRGLRSLSAITGALFVYGFKMSENDSHIIDKIAYKGSKIKNVWVGIHGDPNSPDNKKLIRRSQSLSLKGPKDHPIEINFYNAATANIWG